MAEPADNFALSLALEDDSAGPLEHQFTLPRDGSQAIRIGRSPKNDLTIEHPGISWFHVELRLLQDPQAQLGIKDLSANGTGVRGRGASEFRMIAKGVETALADDSVIVLPMKMKVTKEGEPIDTRKQISVHLSRGNGCESSAQKGEERQPQEQEEEEERDHSSKRVEKKKHKSEAKENGANENKRRRKATQEIEADRDRRKDRRKSDSVERGDRTRRAEAKRLQEQEQEQVQVPSMQDASPEVVQKPERSSCTSEAVNTPGIPDEPANGRRDAQVSPGAPPEALHEMGSQEACTDVAGKAAVQEVVVEPGRIGLRIGLSGQVTDVAEDGKGHLAGVRKGWVFLSIDGLPYSQTLLKEKVAGRQRYHVMFSTDAAKLDNIEAGEKRAKEAKERHGTKSKHRRHREKSRSREPPGQAQSSLAFKPERPLLEKDTQAIAEDDSSGNRGEKGAQRAGMPGDEAPREREAAPCRDAQREGSPPSKRSRLPAPLSSGWPEAQQEISEVSTKARMPARQDTGIDATVPELARPAGTKAREEAGVAGHPPRPEPVHPVVGTRVLTPILESGADIGGARNDQQAKTATGKPISASALPSQFASANDIAAARSLLKGALPPPSTAPQSLPSWVVAGARAQWWSDSLKRLCPVLVSKVDETKRQVIVTFSDDTKVWKSVPFSMLNSKACPLLCSPQEATQASLANPVDIAKAGTAVKQRLGGRKARDRSRSRTPEWWETEKKRILNPVVSQQEIEERAAKEREDKARKDEQRRKELLEAERRKVEEAFEKRKKEAEERQLREEEAWRQKLRAERELEAAMEEQKREDRRSRREEEKSKQVNLPLPPPPPPPGGVAQPIPSAGQAVLPALGIPVVPGLHVLPGMAMGGQPHTVVPGLVGMPLLPGMPGHLFPGGVQHGF